VIQAKVLKGDTPYTERPGSRLPDRLILTPNAPGDRAKLEREVSENEFASYLMYPKVFTDFALATDTYGPVSICRRRPISMAFRWATSCSSRSRRARRWCADAWPKRTGRQGHGDRVLRTQRPAPHGSRCPTAAHGASGSAARRKAEVGNDAHVAAPMPGVISTVAMRRRRRSRPATRAGVDRGDEDGNGIHAERDGHAVGGARGPATRSMPRICWWFTPEANAKRREMASLRPSRSCADRVKSAMSDRIADSYRWWIQAPVWVFSGQAFDRKNTCSLPFR
jgi:pyruvate carboxylase